MPVSKYICLNGGFYKSDQPVLNIDNRAFRYGDALFETIHANGTEPQFLNLHINRLINGMKILRMNIPATFRFEYFKKLITNILNKNRQLQGARIRLTVFRNPGGLYTPDTNDISFLIESSPLEHDKYVLNIKGYAVDIYEEILKPLNVLSNVKSTNSLIYVLAGIYKSEKNLDDSLILNEKQRVVESANSNIFIVKDTKVFTPAINEGCIYGIMRYKVISILKSAGYFINDNCSLTVQDLLTADELFLTNVISGIRWVVAFRQKRYYNKLSKLLVQKLNEISFNDFVINI
jgi:branched-subunit amino acid aminotransferase/4-amino-4-deoxychorismate lyase